MDVLALLSGGSNGGAWSSYILSESVRVARAAAYMAVYEGYSSNDKGFLSGSGWTNSGKNIEDNGQNQLRLVGALAVIIAVIGICVAITTCACVCGVCCAGFGFACAKRIEGYTASIRKGANYRGELELWRGSERDAEVETRERRSTDLEGLSAVANLITIGGNDAIGQVSAEIGATREAVTEWWLAWKKAQRGPRSKHTA